MHPNLTMHQHHFIQKTKSGVRASMNQKVYHEFPLNIYAITFGSATPLLPLNNTVFNLLLLLLPPTIFTPFKLTPQLLSTPEFVLMPMFKYLQIIPNPLRPLYQYSLDRKNPRQHTYTCEQNAQILMRLEKDRLRKFGSSGKLVSCDAFSPGIEA